VAKGLRSYVNLGYVDERDLKRYLRGNLHREAKKSNKDGIIGITEWGRPGGKSLWYANFPPFLRIRKKKHDTALGAAMEYNRQMLALFGEDAVLCDVNAAMELDRRRK
jgi:hypothetical protein